MVSQKKNNTPGKQKFKEQMKTPTPNKFSKMNFNDDSGDDSEDMAPTKKTPLKGAATPNQSMSKKKDMRVSFQLQNKSTPSGGNQQKTPKGTPQQKAGKGTPIPTKKTPLGKQEVTQSGKKGLKEFGGMEFFGARIEKVDPPEKGRIYKAIKKAKKEEEEDDDDDEDDDDFDDEEMDDSSMDDEGLDDEEMDDSDEEDDDDDEEPEISEKDLRKQIMALTGQIKKAEKTPQKDVAKKPGAKEQTPQKKGEVKTPQSSAKNAQQKRKLKEMEESDDEEEDDDDEDEDSEEEEDSDDEDEEESDEEEETPKKQPKVVKKVAALPVTPKDNKKGKVNNEKSPQKPNDKQTPAKTPVKNDQNHSPKKVSQNVAQALAMEKSRELQRDVNNLFIRNIPMDVTVDELKALSPDILGVSLPKSKFHKKNPNKVKNYFAFLEFANEKKAEENYPVLLKKKLRGQPVFVDFVGVKSKNQVISDKHQGAASKEYNKRKLFVSGLPSDVTILQLAQLFPKSNLISVNSAPQYRNATIQYFNEDDAAEAFKANADCKISGKKVSVLYSIEVEGKKRKKNKKKNVQNKANSKQSNSSAPPSKKPKVVVKEDPIDEFDDDDDDEDDDDSSDEE